MPEINVKHVVSFSSEDKVHKAENLVKPETYRKWKCGSPGEKNATVVLQFEKASQIHSLDIGNECSAFIEVLVGRSSDSVKDFQVLLVASSFMSPLESRNETHTNRVRMFGPEKLSQNTKDEKWDRVQIVCSQPFNKNITYGLSFIKFHSPSEKTAEAPKSSEAQSTSAKLGAFNVKSDDDDEEESLLKVGSWFGKQKDNSLEDVPSSSLTNTESPSYAAAVLASSNVATTVSPKNNSLKRKIGDTNAVSVEPPVKKPPASSMDTKFIVYKPLDVTPERKKAIVNSPNTSSVLVISKKPENEKTTNANNSIPSKKPAKPVKKKIPFSRIMKDVVFVLSGFVNPLRSELRDKAVEMGAKYQGDWNKSCTHLVCAFLNTPKYIQVRGQDGKIVTKEWILDCDKTKTLLPWRDYMLGKYSKDTSGEEESGSEESDETDEEYEIRRAVRKGANVAKKDIKTNGTLSLIKKAQSLDSQNTVSSKYPLQRIIQDEDSGTKEESETEDDDAISDYIADTDVDAESDSGGNTEDELRRVEKKLTELRKAKKTGSPKKEMKVTEEITEKPNVDNLPLPELPNLFKKRHFYLFGDFSTSKHHDMQRYITAYNGVIEDDMGCDKIKYVITEGKWDKKFEEALCENEDLIFVKPLWIYKCHEAGKLVPFQPFIVIPES